jgi:prepilin-type N-terminal cleavage/methylation domain-containing protein
MRIYRRPSNGFTLVELLVVLAIIGVLAAIVTPALWRAVLRAREARVFTELNNLHTAVETYKQQHNDYPVDFSSIPRHSAAEAITALNTAGNVVPKHFRRAFTRHQENLADIFVPGNVITIPDPAEALVLALAGLNKDPRRPITGSAEKDGFFEFDKKRLRDVNGNGYLSYFPLDSPLQPYVYFASNTYDLATYPVLTQNPGQRVGQVVRPYKRRIGGAEAQLALEYANPTTFQILAAGVQGEFGTVLVDEPDSRLIPAVFKVFPTGEADNLDTDTVFVEPYSREDYDTISNFSEGKTLGDHLE